MSSNLPRIHYADRRPDEHQEVVRGLTSNPRWISPKWLYDAYGSELYERITVLPEYYPSRTERALLDAVAPEISTLSAIDTVVELGGGSSDKIRLVLDACLATSGLQKHVAVDVSEVALKEATASLSRDYPTLDIHGVMGDFTGNLLEPLVASEGHRLVVLLGGTIGNLLPAERAVFLDALCDALRPGELILLGTGLVTETAVMISAYDDSTGVTAEFNRNALRVLNREIGSDFDVNGFDHVATWDEDHQWIEMRLRAVRPMTVRLPNVALDLSLVEGEEIRTEISAKFHRSDLISELSDSGFELRHWWSDSAQRFALSLAQRI